MSRSNRNKTLTLDDREKSKFLSKIISSANISDANRRFAKLELQDKIVLADVFEFAQFLPDNFIDLLILDPPYNLTKNFGKADFKKSDIDNYSKYVDRFLSILIPTLKETATVYLCGDWYSSTSLHAIALKHFHVHNRITWQREKGRGAKKNWKNAHEDIWFCTKSNDFTFNVDRVKTRRRVIAPYREEGKPKDWVETQNGNFRDTHPSNFWDDLTIPYWSMSENTVHPTQKPEKLIAKLILASSNEGDFVFDPFVGSGTSCVVAKKLKRKYLGIDVDENYACISQKRLDAVEGGSIQGYADGVFWERNTLNCQPKR